jgi:hypothetical protein
LIAFLNLIGTAFFIGGGAFGAGAALSVADLGATNRFRTSVALRFDVTT